MNALAIDVRQLTRTYPEHRSKRLGTSHRYALNKLNLEIPRGEVHGLLGPNGAGKTTLCKILSTSLLPSDGEAYVFGNHVVKGAKKIRDQVGVVYGGDRGLYDRLTVWQNLDYWASLYGLSKRTAKARIAYLLESVGLNKYQKSRVETLSRGMKQRLHLARGLIGDPELIIFDEPTAGMDPLAVKAFRDFVDQLKNANKTLLITTHDLAEAEQMCSRISLIDRGKAIATESPANLAKLTKRSPKIEASHVSTNTINALERINGVGHIDREEGRIIVQTDDDIAVEAVIRTLLDANIHSIRTIEPSLQDVYFELIGDRGLDVR